MENVKQKFLQSHFLQRDHQGFLKDVEVRSIDKTQASDPHQKGVLLDENAAELCILVALILKVTISSLFRLTHTFTIMFGSPSTKIFSSVPAIVLS